MPTVHISLPSKMYEEIKKRAAELGIQATDLIKLYIRQGLQNGLMPVSLGSSIDSKTEGEGSAWEELRRLRKEVQALRKMIIATQGKYREAYELYRYLNERIDTLEDMIIPLLQKKGAREEVRFGDTQ